MRSPSPPFVVAVLASCIAVGAACKKDKPKEQPPSAQDARTTKRMSPKAKAAEEALMWDASVQKIEELIRDAESKGDSAAADELRRKLTVSQDGAAQARRRLQAIEAAEAQARQQAGTR